MYLPPIDINQQINVYKNYLKDVGNRFTEVPMAEVVAILPIQTYNAVIISVVTADDDQYKAIPHVPAITSPKTKI